MTLHLSNTLFICFHACVSLLWSVLCDAFASGLCHGYDIGFMQIQHELHLWIKTIDTKLKKGAKWRFVSPTYTSNIKWKKRIPPFHLHVRVCKRYSWRWNGFAKELHRRNKWIFVEHHWTNSKFLSLPLFFLNCIFKIKWELSFANGRWDLNFGYEV